jgi:L-asparaginase II
MTLHPEYVSGTGRHDLAFMQEGKGDWVAKIGADGVQVIGIRSAGIGIAIKVIDGNQRAVISAAVSSLSQLGLIRDVSQSLLAGWAQPSIVNASGITTGVVRAVFTLEDKISNN